MKKTTSYFKHFVYRHIRLDNNMPFYVGIGTCSKSGVCNRAYSIKRNIFWSHIVSKTDFRVEIIFETDDYKEAISKEIEFIKLYGRLNRQTGTLCNLTDGGEGFRNFIFTEGDREKCRTRQLGKPLSDATKKNMSAAQNNRYKQNPISPMAMPVYQYSIKGLFVKNGILLLTQQNRLGLVHLKYLRLLQKIIITQKKIFGLSIIKVLK